MEAGPKGNKKNPGKDKRRKVKSKTGWPIDLDLNHHNIYQPGTLFLYNAETKKKYTWDTGQGDSEVLLVDGETVYYRVDDELYKAPIGKNKIGSGQLLAKEDVVRDMHWAFMGPAVTNSPTPKQ